jgi:hypothetical protein
MRERMPIVSERTAHQGGRSTCFAEVELDVAIGDGPGPATVELAPGAEASQGDWYLPSVRVGVELACRLASPRGQVRVVVRRLRTTTVDSTEMIVLWTAARATLRALGADPDLAGSLDRANRTVTIPY